MPFPFSLHCATHISECSEEESRPYLHPSTTLWDSISVISCYWCPLSGRRQGRLCSLLCTDCWGGALLMNAPWGMFGSPRNSCHWGG